jgi:hypothetical protein
VTQFAAELPATSNLAVPAGSGAFLGSATEPPAFDELLAAVEAAEDAGQRGTGPDQPMAPAETNFADLLRKLTDGATDTVGEPANLANPASLAEPADPADSAAVDVAVIAVQAIERTPGSHSSRRPSVASNVTAFGRPDARARLEMLMQLRQIGVPVSVNPQADIHSLYEALESILDELPPAALPPRGAGEVLAIVGESAPALRAAHTCAAMLRIPRRGIRVAGLRPLLDQSGSELDYPELIGQPQALRLRTELSRADLPSIVVIATDVTEAGPEDPWAAEMLAALRPTAVWAVVDARWKTEDTRVELDRLGRVDALVVHSAQLSASPASVWDLDLPLALLDDRAASTFAWTGLLFRLLRTGARHRASA